MKFLKFESTLSKIGFVLIYLLAVILLLILPCHYSNEHKHLKFINYVDKWVQQLFYSSYDYDSLNRKVTIVKIDENTTKELWRFPFDRKYYAQVVDNLKKNWAAVIWFDITFDGKSSEDWESDELFQKSVENAWNVVIWWEKMNRNGPNWEFIRSYIVDKNNPTWYYNVNEEEDSWIVFSTNLFEEWVLSKSWWPDFEYFWLAVLRKYYSVIYGDNSYLTQNFEKTENWIKLNQLEIPYSYKWNKEILINYYDKAGFDFDSLTFKDAYNEDYFENENNVKLVKDRIVLIWATLDKWIWEWWAIDQKKTPTSEPMFWVYIHANFLNTVLNNAYIKYFNRFAEFIIILIFSAITVWVNFRKWVHSFTKSLIIIIFFAIVYGFVIQKMHLSLSYPFELALAIIFWIVYANLIKYFFENKKSTTLNKALSEYVSKDIADEILSWRWTVNLWWEKKMVLTFFSDIEWFTSITEKLKPEVLIKYLKEYLSEMSEIIMEKRWFINKYEWDAILALWWVFRKNDETDVDITKLACDASLEQLSKLKELNAKWEKSWFKSIKIRIWINIWNAILWNIWLEWKKIEFTAIWDSVNLASRLEEINKYYWTNLCVSENIYRKVKQHYVFRYLDKIKVKWKNTAVDIYELVDYKWNVSEEKLLYIKSYETAVKMYQDMQFEEAYKEFKHLKEIWWKDVTVYLDRCKFYMENPPERTWDRVWTMQTK